MVVRLRLARHGTRNNPFYHIVAIRDQAARDAKPIEKLGEYDPIPRPRLEDPASSSSATAGSSSSSQPRLPRGAPIGPILSSGLEKTQENKQLEKRIEWNAQRIHYWLGVGAQPSKPVARLLDRAGLIPQGKFYKGMYRPLGQAVGQTHGKGSQPLGGASSSVILEAAGVSPARQQQHASSGQGSAAATPLRQGEVADNGATRTDPQNEALKQQTGQATVDQAA